MFRKSSHAAHSNDSGQNLRPPTCCCLVPNILTLIVNRIPCASNPERQLRPGLLRVNNWRHGESSSAAGPAKRHSGIEFREQWSSFFWGEGGGLKPRLSVWAWSIATAVHRHQDVRVCWQWRTCVRKCRNGGGRGMGWLAGAAVIWRSRSSAG